MASPRKARSILARCPVCAASKLLWLAPGQVALEVADVWRMRHLRRKHAKLVAQLRQEKRQWEKSNS